MQKIRELLDRIKLLVPESEEMRQRVRVVERHILLPIKMVALPIVLWKALVHIWDHDVVTQWDATMHMIYLFFVFYFMISLAWGILIWGMAGLKRWQLQSVIFVGILADTFFLAGVMVGSHGFDSPVFWLFCLWIIRTSVCLPTFLMQLSMALLICIFYVSAGLME